MNQISPYQFKEAKTNTGLMLSNHIKEMFGESPMMLKKAVTRLLSSENINNVNTLLDSLPVQKFKRPGIFYWDVTGSSDQNIPLVEARFNGAVVSASDNNVFANGAPGELVFASALFSDVHMIVGELNEIYQLRITGEPYEEGGNYVFPVELMGNDPSGMPGEELVTGKRFSKDFSPVEDIMSLKGGEITFVSPARVGNEMTTIRIEHKEPGNNIGRKLKTDLVLLDSRGNEKVVSAWMPAVEWTLEKTWSYEKANAISFARTNRTADGRYMNKGKSGNYIKQGMGLRQQQEYTNSYFYSDFSLKLLNNALYDIGEGRLDYGDRTIVVRTGERGADQAHQEINADVSGWTLVSSHNNPAVIHSVPSDMHSNAMQAGYQFTEYISSQNYHVKFETDPSYSSTVRNKKRHPKGGVAESYRYDIYFIGSRNEPNIYKVELEGGDDWGYSTGFRNAITGQRGITTMSHKEDSTTYTRYGSFGAAIVDSSRCIALIPSMLAG